MIRRERFTQYNQDIYIPKAFCFVTAAGSNEPYFNLVMQLIESIKNTPYKNVPIYILDCGFEDKDRIFLEQQYGVVVKKINWSVDTKLLQFQKRYDELLEGWKGVTERPFLHEHFPGYKLYFWLDADSWIQDASGLRAFIKEAERTGIGCTRESAFSGPWKRRFGFQHFALRSLPQDAQSVLEPKQAIINNAYCIRADFAKKYARDARMLLAQKGVYHWGFDLASLNYSIHTHIRDVNVLQDNYYNYADMWPYGFPFLDQEGFLYSPNLDRPICVCMVPKYLPQAIPMLPRKSSLLTNLFIAACIYIHCGFGKLLGQKLDGRIFYQLISGITRASLETLYFRK